MKGLVLIGLLSSLCLIASAVSLVDLAQDEWELYKVWNIPIKS
jgi:hypothetical protein